ncbi:hypothetical protein OE699_11880 [Sedimentimonas flavescens]|uniref:Uncharacterized protein n=1 Tax=Sedimentimonas flavescens TaxID=2851012 RepID=A0ABT3A0L5_9RHOB|nr:hypothetical protein [Sedimentimonas flavescens]MCV2879547.1 hypothetical protein [Sedimentimonas flavescens]WBL32286.1 hypothetical protein O5O51_11145 [Sinirhodobacter sp. HNIBRBA609]
MDMPQKELDAIAAERAKIFTPKWFARLLSGRLSPGDTFWLGNYGILLWVVPALVMLAMLIAISAPGNLDKLVAVGCAVIGFYRLAILRAQLRTNRATPGPKGWRRAGVVWTLLEAAGLLLIAGVFIFGR